MLNKTLKQGDVNIVNSIVKIFSKIDMRTNENIPKSKLDITVTIPKDNVNAVLLKSTSYKPDVMLKPYENYYKKHGSLEGYPPHFIVFDRSHSVVETMCDICFKHIDNYSIKAVETLLDFRYTIQFKDTYSNVDYKFYLIVYKD